MTVTTGTVSRFTSLTSENNVKVIQHDATIHAGNSGGPLVDASGCVVGINTYGADSESLNYAINVNYIRSFCEENGIDFDVEPDHGFPLVPVLIAVAVLVVIAIVVFAIMNRRKAPSKTGPEPTPIIPNPPVSPTSPSITSDSGFRIQGVTGRFAGKRYAINGTVRIGRDTAQCQIAYPEGSQGISRIHCELIVQNGKLYLKDLGASYGTFLKNGQRLASNQVVELQPGEQFYLASPNETFQIGTRGGV